MLQISENIRKKSVEKIRIPKWLEHVNTKHVDKIRDMKENKVAMKSKAHARNKISEAPKPYMEHISLRAAERLFCDVTNILHDARGRGKTYLFEELGYSLTSWISPQLSAMKEVGRPKLSWVYSSKYSQNMNIGDIPITNVSEYPQDHNVNKKLYEEFLKKCEHLILSINHDVFVLDTEWNIDFPSSDRRKLVFL